MSESNNPKLTKLGTYKVSTLTAYLAKEMIKNPKLIFKAPIALIKDIPNNAMASEFKDYAKKHPVKTVALFAAGAAGVGAMAVTAVVATPLIVSGAVFTPVGLVAAAALVGVAAAGSIAFTVAGKKLLDDTQGLATKKREIHNQAIIKESLLSDELYQTIAEERKTLRGRSNSMSSEVLNNKVDHPSNTPSKTNNMNKKRSKTF